jgi:hypothetical protein
MMKDKVILRVGIPNENANKLLRIGWNLREYQINVKYIYSKELSKTKR